MLVPPGDGDALAEAVRRLAGDRAAADAVGLSARASVERSATVTGYAERLLAIAERALERP